MGRLARCAKATHLAAAILLGATGCAGSGPEGTDLAARLRVASVAEASGQPEVATSVLASLAVASPENADVQARYVRALARAGRLAEAEAVALRVLRRHPGNAPLLLSLGQIRLLEGKAADALESFQAVLRAAPADVAAATGQGIALDLLGRHDEAQASYRAALATDPQNLAALNNMGMSLILADRPGDAVAVLEPLARRSDATDRVRNNLAAARAAAGLPAADAASPGMAVPSTGSPVPAIAAPRATQIQVPRGPRRMPPRIPPVGGPVLPVAGKLRKPVRCRRKPAQRDLYLARDSDVKRESLDKIQS